MNIKCIYATIKKANSASEFNGYSVISKYSFECYVMTT